MSCFLEVLRVVGLLFMVLLRFQQPGVREFAVWTVFGIAPLLPFVDQPPEQCVLSEKEPGRFCIAKPTMLKKTQRGIGDPLDK